MLEITDNIDAQGKVHSPGHVVTYDDPDPYLVVAQTRERRFFDIANEVSKKIWFLARGRFCFRRLNLGFRPQKRGNHCKRRLGMCEIHFTEKGRKCKLTQLQL
ncbi:MAG: hypothetical protein CM1200mP30_19390 [Pseudomonadota bacterium]|nr:MAG: hypothetical protein CM1200mP30_19390 [Pseudomonadota bacterium]